MISRYKTMMYVVITLLAGMGIPMMASLNSRLGQALGSPVTASTILFGVALCVGIVVLLSSSAPIQLKTEGLPFYFYAGGLFVAFYIFSITWVAPRLGLANAIFIILLGQIITSVIIEHFGWLGAKHIPIDGYRVAGVVLMVGGIFLARFK